MSHRSSRSRARTLALLSLSLSACSAIVQPDPSRLGGMDAGGGNPDTGTSPGTDTGVPPGTDGGPRPDAYMPDMPDTGPVCPPSCDDGVECTTDRCEGSSCVHEENDGRCPGARCNATLGCVPVACTSDEECDDGDRCNVTERCMPGSSETGCVGGTAPDCNDGVSCTDDGCEPATGCVHTRFDDRCDDGVGCTTDVCTGTAGPTGCEYRLDDTMCNGVCQMGGRCTNRGCTDTSPRVCPDDGSRCTVERCDEAAGGCVSEALDADGDGFPAASAGGTPCAGGTDCDDMRMAVNPRGTEMCGNGLDDDCNPATSDTCTGTSGDTCATARSLSFSSSGGVATGTATVTLSTLRDDYTSHCGGDTGNDAIFYFDVMSTSDVRIETTGAVDTVVATATTCSDAAWQFRCNDDRNRSTDTTSRIWLRNVVVPPGGAPVRMYVLVDEYSMGDADPVTLTVTLNAPSPNVCPTGGSARPLDISGGGSVFGTLPIAGGAIGGQRGSCQPTTSAAPEAMFRIEEGDRTLDSLEASAPGFVPDLYVRYGGCSTGTSTELSCVRGGSSGGSGGTAHQDAVTGMSSSTLFYVFVDNFPVTGGEYELHYDP